MIEVVQMTGSLQYGGIETFVLNILKKIDRNKIRFTFILPESEIENDYHTLVLSLGAKIIRIPRRRNFFKHFFALIKVFSTHNFDVLHMHSSSISYILPLFIAKHFKVKKRIIHSHNSNFSGNIFTLLLEKINKRLIKYVATDFFACSQVAADWMFTKKIANNSKIIFNAIDPLEFAYNEGNRNKIRKEFDVKSDEILIGHVGRFSHQKNHSYLVEIFSKLLENNKKYKLMLIGNGELLDEIKRRSIILGIEKYVIFAGIRNDVNTILSAFDLFIMPSRYEGLPVTLIEAQCSNLPCLLSSNITKDVVINKNVDFFHLDENFSSVRNKIETLIKNFKREDKSDFFDSKYNMAVYVKSIEKEYGYNRSDINGKNNDF